MTNMAFWLDIYCRILADCTIKSIGNCRKILHLRTKQNKINTGFTPYQLSEVFNAGKLACFFKESQSFRLRFVGI